MILYAVFIMGVVFGCIAATPKWRVIFVYLAATSISIGLLSTNVMVLFWNGIFFALVSLAGYYCWVKEKLL